MLANDRTKYEEFWKEFGRQIKFGAYSDYGMHAELLRDLLLFWSAKEQKMVTLQEYVDKMPAEQKYIYFAAGDSSDRLAKLPSTELVLGKGYDVLLLTEDVDEFCLQILRTYPRKDAEGKDGTVEFKNVNSGDLGLETEEEKKAAEDATAENKDLFDAMKTALDGKVKEVKVSTRLKDHPVCLSADGTLSIEMAKVLSTQPGSEGVKRDTVLELNANHPVFAVLNRATAVTAVLAGVMVVVAILLTGTTIRMSAASRRTETEIMRYVGASNWTIRLPFILEGAIASLIGSVLSCLMLSAIVNVFVTGWLAKSVTWIPYVNQLTVLVISPFLVVGAILLSIIASTISLRRYLRA